MKTKDRRPPAPKGYKPVEPGEPVKVGYRWVPKWNPDKLKWKPVEAYMASDTGFTSRLHTDLWFCKPKEAARA